MQGALQQIGPYRLEEKLASGGMAAVYRAVREGAGGFERPVAVKVLHPHLAPDPEYLEMFCAEARLASRLAHPVLVPVTDLGEVEGTHYMVMDLLEGETLADLYDRFRRNKKPFPRGHALWIMARVLDGLHYAHELKGAQGEPMNVVHRDLSPRNIFVTRSGGVRLVDFGIARSTTREGQTQAGVVKGTVPYMAPEQARGQAPDRRADIFAAGVLLHHLICGEVPVAPGNTEAQRIALAKLEIKPQLKRIHLQLRPILQKALAARPEDRFDNAEEMADALRAVALELEPDHQPEMLAALVSQALRRKTRKKRKKKNADADQPERPSTEVRAARDDAPMRQTRGPDGEVVEVAVRRLPDIPTWDVARTLGLVAVVILLLGLCYTFAMG